MLGAGSFVPTFVTRLTIGPVRPGPGAYPELRLARKFHTAVGENPVQTTQLERGVVSSRVTLLSRSAETQPPFGRFVVHPLSVDALQGRLRFRTI